MEPWEEQFAVAEHHGEGIIKIMSDPACHHAKGAKSFLLNDLFLGGLQFLKGGLQAGSPFEDYFFELGILFLHSEVEKPGFYEVLNPQDDFRAVDRFIDKIFGAVGEGAHSSFRTDIGGQDQNGEVFVFGDHRLKLLHDREPVKVGHVEIEEHDIGLKLLINAQGEAGIGNSPDIGTSVELEDAFEKTNVRGFVVNNEDFHVAMTIGIHGMRLGFWLFDGDEQKLGSTILEEHLLCLSELF